MRGALNAAHAADIAAASVADIAAASVAQDERHMHAPQHVTSLTPLCSLESCNTVGCTEMHCRDCREQLPMLLAVPPQMTQLTELTLSETVSSANGLHASTKDSQVEQLVSMMTQLPILETLALVGLDVHEDATEVAGCSAA